MLNFQRFKGFLKSGGREVEQDHGRVPSSDFSKTKWQKSATTLLSERIQDIFHLICILGEAAARYGRYFLIFHSLLEKYTVYK